MVGSNLTERQLQEIVDKTILYADKDGDGKINFDEFCEVSSCMALLDLTCNFLFFLHLQVVSGLDVPSKMVIDLK